MSLKVEMVRNSQKKQQQIGQIVDNAFKKLSEDKISKNRTYLATAPDKTDIFISESELGKQAEVCLTNGHFKNKTYAKFTMKRSVGNKSEILSDDEKMPMSMILRILGKYFK